MLTYAYGALKPTEGFELLLEQLRLASRYRNALIELEIYRRAALDFGVDKDEVRAAYSTDSRALRKASGLGWGTYQLVEDDVKRASKTATPRFRRFDGTGRIGATMQACSGFTESKTGDALKFGERLGKSTLVRLRIMPDRYITLPVILHRPLAPGRVVRAFIVVDRVGDRWMYGLRIVSRAERERHYGTGHVAINFGWRRVPEGVRVAVAVGDHGTDELVLPSGILDAYRHSEGLRSLADKIASEHIGDPRRRTRKRREGLGDGTPREESLSLRKVHLEPGASLHHWALRDRHLYQWERNEYRKAIRRRRERITQWVQHLASRYATLAIETYSLKTLIEQAEQQTIREARHVRFLVAPGETRQICASIFGDRLTKLPRKARTMVCSVCGGALTGDRARSIELRCESCGEERDQDHNNAENQHAAAAE